VAETQRAKANTFSDEKRQRLMARGLQLIYGEPAHARTPLPPELPLPGRSLSISSGEPSLAADAANSQPAQSPPPRLLHRGFPPLAKLAIGDDGCTMITVEGLL
jgi:hypothetical protein